MKYHYEIQIDTKNDRSLMLRLKDKNKPNYIGQGVNIIYIYKLVDSDIQYPNKKSKVIYIGEVCKNKRPTGLRFNQHIALKKKGAMVENINYILHTYYWNGTKLVIYVFEVENVTDSERKLRKT